MRQMFEVQDLFVKWKKLMEKSNGRKIKVLQFDNIGEYEKDQLLQFVQNNSIGIHFTVQKQIRVVRELNYASLKKVWCLLSNA